MADAPEGHPDTQPTLPAQSELPLPAPPLAADTPHLPARMVNEHVYCPRLAYLEWVQGEWADSADTVEGKRRHARVDREGAPLPDPTALEELPADLRTRAVMLSSDRLGLVARIDVVETSEGEVIPVDFKRGKRPHVARGAWLPERVQLCVQGLILEDNGYRCAEGALYFVESKERVRVVFDEELRRETRAAIDGLRLTCAGGRLPPPLEDSPKCPRCSLVGICLPDEVNHLRNPENAPRPLAVGVDEALPLYVQAQGARISKKGDVLEIAEDEDGPKTRARLIDVSQVVLMGNVKLTTPTLHELMRREIPVSWYSYGGWFLGHSHGTGHRNVELRTAQYRASFDERFCLGFAKSLVAAKIRNARTLMRRNWRGDDATRQEVMDTLKRSAGRAGRVHSMGELLGVEGDAAATYFRYFAQMLKMETEEGALPAFQFERRTRRPPADPVNALLSFAYAMLTRSLTVTLSGVGLDPYRGFYHQPRYGRPALALDLMEPFRAIVADSTVIQVINNGEVGSRDFIMGGTGCALKPDGRKRFIAAYERRLSQETTHPIFGYRVSMRRLLEIQARLLGRALLGEIDEYPHYLPR
jgi:CRISPR-associated protein Cas1